MMKSKLRNDLILISAILVISLAVFLVLRLSLRAGNTVLVSVDGKKVHSFSLDSDTVKSVKTEMGENVIEIKDGNVRVKSADCSDKICVNHKPISKVGQTVVCLPHKLVVEILE